MTKMYLLKIEKIFILLDLSMSNLWKSTEGAVARFIDYQQQQQPAYV